VELLRAGAVAVGAAGAELVAGLDLRLATGDRLGLVGPNGSGKSTLLRVLAGVAAPLDGRVARPPGVRVGLLPQSVAALPGRTVTEVLRAATLRARELEARLRESETRLAFGGTADDAVEHAALAAEFDRAGGYGAEAAAREVAAALGFRAGGRDLTCAELSPGERRRLQLAVTLAAAPDVLLLDEPTNHLDLTAREWLTRRLGAYAGAVVVVSHDRALLDAATTRTLFLAEGRAWHEPGPYSLARRRRDAAVGAGHKRARELERDARRLERMAVELAAFGRKAAARRRRAERDGRALRVEARVAAPAERVAPPQLAPRQAPSTRLRAAGGETLVTVRHLAAEGLLSDVGLELRRGERVVLVGPNGSGKSTVLRAVAGDLTGLGPRAELDYLPGVKLRVVDQLDRGLTPGVPLLEQVAAAVGEAAGRRLLADAGVPARTWELTPEQVSGGERIRAGLALAFAHPADLWLLDEPTNDLDLAAVEALETQLTAMLAGGSAALLLVTHDRRLAERVADEAWSVVDGSLLRYRDVGAYLRGEHEPDAPVPPAVATTTVATTAVAWADPPGVAETHPPAAAAAVARRPRPGWSDPALLALEDERAAVLRMLDDPRDQTARDRERLLRRLNELEAALMARYGDLVPPPAPRYRVVEGGAVVVGDVLTDRSVGTKSEGRQLLLLRFAEAAQTLGGARSGGAAGAGAGPAHDPWAPGVAAGPRPPEARATLVDGVAHLRLLEPADACLLPWARSALVDAATRLAFTVMGAEAVQLQSEAPPGARWLRPVADGWHVAELRDYLRAEGWA